MSGRRKIFRYLFRNAANSGNRTCYVECDADAATLTLGGVSNSEAPTTTPANISNFEMPVLSGSRGRKVRARMVKIEYTASTVSVSAGTVAWVPVFRPATFNAYVVGQTGSHRSVSCELLAKVDGSPTVTGARRP
jgi:hypothetical protein